MDISEYAYHTIAWHQIAKSNAAERYKAEVAPIQIVPVLPTTEEQRTPQDIPLFIKFH